MTMKPKTLSTLTSGMLLAAILLAGSGCSGLFRPEVTPHPDAPILIVKTFAGFARGAVYDKERNAMIPCGWFYLGRYDGWSLHKFDWEKQIERQQE
ncbi:MAG: hypothetical protein HN370_00070 [Phycisphaerales bacterium]|nr:hypothetical protein [Phycisphaerales bacterium]